MALRLSAVVFDWAGTLADHGSVAPVGALQEIFSDAGVPITNVEARLSMGLAKKSHIAAILTLPRVHALWLEKHGAPASVDALYAAFIPRQVECLKHHSDLIEGIPKVMEALRTRGLAIGSTTGYTRPMLDYLMMRAREQGFAPDAAFCPDDVPQGRPAPWMCYLNAIRLNAYPMSTLVKIGDTPVDIAEGLNAGMWTVGITRTGNEVGLSAEEWLHASSPEKAALLATADHKLRAAGAHYTAENVADCLDILEEIETRLALGELPHGR